MTDYIISEEAFVKVCKYLPSIADEIYARPLSSALVKERERIHNALDYIKHVDNEKEYYVTVYLGDVRDIVNGGKP